MSTLLKISNEIYRELDLFVGLNSFEQLVRQRGRMQSINQSINKIICLTPRYTALAHTQLGPRLGYLRFKQVWLVSFVSLKKNE